MIIGELFWIYFGTLAFLLCPPIYSHIQKYHRKKFKLAPLLWVLFSFLSFFFLLSCFGKNYFLIGISYLVSFILFPPLLKIDPKKVRIYLQEIKEKKKIRMQQLVEKRKLEESKRIAVTTQENTSSTFSVARVDRKVLHYLKSLERNLRAEGVLVDGEHILSFIDGNSKIADSQNEMMMRITEYKNAAMKYGSIFGKLFYGSSQSGPNTIVFLTNLRVIVVYYFYDSGLNVYSSWTAYSLGKGMQYSNNDVRIRDFTLYNIYNQEQFKQFIDEYTKHRAELVAFQSPDDAQPLNGFHSKVLDDGTEMKMEFVNDKTNGYIFIKKPDVTHIGVGFNNDFIGYTVQSFRNGGRFEGDFLDGYFSGTGIINFSDGSKYEGELCNSQPNGYGCFHMLDGYKFYGYFENGSATSQGQLFDNRNQPVKLDSGREGFIMKTLNTVAAIYITKKIIERL